MAWGAVAGVIGPLAGGLIVDQLTWRWVFFFLGMALANEFVWRTFSTDVWVAVKTFAVIPVTLLFALAQAPLMMRYKGEKAEPSTGS